ncbi:GNAT family N-acetyltransferase [Lysobacter niastensis]|uniref:GNAT family N-acetyltransferase n=1 Tax=Lysobacter niastensis TaxID=380629 RepID=A0ABS0B4D7_9GAMM|nr:GNAT family N-acetyltransferase [Lysobacter niastensis]MBF6023473.1 GNAT family N-acetyltransferase [Lysobacter niastensis]
MLVRRATAADAATLTALTQASGAYEGEYRSILDGLSITPEQIDRELFFLVEDDHGGTVGYYGLIVGSAAVDLSGTREAELDLMFVADHAQGGGLGGLLFRHMAQQAREHGIARVRIVSHPPAESFYLRMGATRIGTQPPHGRATWERPVLELRI